MCTGGTKKKKAAKSAEEARIRAESEAAAAAEAAAQAAERKLIASGETAAGEITAAGQPKAEETERLARYKEKAVTPGETLLTQTGPIAQALAKRVQERIDQPGLDYQRDLPAYTAGVTEPLWRSLKARGIAAPPGAEAGLGGQQYMKGAEPALAALRAGAISEDIGRGERYGEVARGYQGSYEELEGILADLIRGRQFDAETLAPQVKMRGVETGAPYGPSGVAAGSAYRVESARTTEATRKEQLEESQAFGKMLGERLVAVVLPTLADYGGGNLGQLQGQRQQSSTIQGGVGGTNTGVQQTPYGRTQTWSPYTSGGQQSSPYARALASRTGRYA